MAEIHHPNVIGPLAAAGNDGTAGQVLTSAGAGAQVVWSANATGNANRFTFTSALSLTHNIAHNLGNDFPDITVWDQATNFVIVPSSIETLDSNTLFITFLSATAIAGTVVG